MPHFPEDHFTNTPEDAERYERRRADDLPDDVPLDVDEYDEAMGADPHYRDEHGVIWYSQPADDGMMEAAINNVLARLLPPDDEGAADA